MRKIYMFIYSLSACAISFAQSFEWAKVEGLYAYDYGYGIANDAAGNVYVAGKYEQQAVFSGNVLPMQGNHDSYLAKYSASGSLNWIRTCGGFNGDYAHALTCDHAGNLVVAGEVEDGNATITFPGSTVTLNPVGDNDVFVASYDAAGGIRWARTDGYKYNEKALGVACDPSGNVFVCGYFKDTTAFDGKLIPSKGAEDIFIAKYDPNGNILWMKHAGGPGEDEAKAVTCDASGNVYVCGMYSHGAIFGGSTLATAITPYGQFFDGFIAKYDSDGALIWVNKIEGDYDDVAWSITKDQAGKLYVAGEFSGARFDGQNIVWPNGRQDAFAACYDQNGNFQWVNHGGGPIADRARGIGTDGVQIFITGQFGLNGTFGSSSVAAADSSDIFISALDNMGNFLWTKTVGGIRDSFEIDGFESGIAVCAIPGSAYVTGTVLDGGVFDTYSFAGYKRTDVFVTKLSTVVGLDENSKNSNAVKLFPNPAREKLLVRMAEERKDAELLLFNVYGQKVLDHKIRNNDVVDLISIPDGFYTYQIIENGRTLENGKLIIE
jgi:hypothetical protein